MKNKTLNHGTNTAPIDIMYAVLSEDENGNEGIVSSVVGPLGLMPLVSGSFERINQLIAHSPIEEMKRVSKIKLVKYEGKQLLKYL